MTASTAQDLQRWVFGCVLPEKEKGTWRCSAGQKMLVLSLQDPGMEAIPVPLHCSSSYSVPVWKCSRCSWAPAALLSSEPVGSRELECSWEVSL